MQELERGLEQFDAVDVIEFNCTACCAALRFGLMLSQGVGISMNPYRLRAAAASPSFGGHSIQSGYPIRHAKCAHVVAL